MDWRTPSPSNCYYIWWLLIFKGPWLPGAGVIWNGDPLEPPVIPAKAGIQSGDSTFPRVCGVDSRFRGNDEVSQMTPISAVPWSVNLEVPGHEEILEGGLKALKDKSRPSRLGANSTCSLTICLARPIRGSGRIAFTRAGPGLHYPIFLAHFLAQNSANRARMLPFAASVSPIKR